MSTITPRSVGPKVVRNEAKHKYVSAHPTKPLGVQDDFTKEINDYGFRPVVVYHNLAPAELYEKVRSEFFCGWGNP